MNQEDPSSASLEALLRLASEPDQVVALHDVFGEFFHTIRNRLNGLQMSLYLARRGDSAPDPSRWDEPDRLYREAERVVDQFQTVCRPMDLKPITLSLDLLLKEFVSRWAPRFEGREVTLKLDLIGPPVPGRLDPTRWTQALDALAEWRAARMAPKSRIALRAWSLSGTNHLEWRESGGGETVPAGKCGGGVLPMAVLARVVGAHGGTLKRRPRPGLDLRMEWPVAGADLDGPPRDPAELAVRP